MPRPSEYADKNLSGKVGTVAEAAREAEIILLAAPFAEAEDALKNCGDLTNKIVIDATNPIAMRDGALGLTVGFDSSGAETARASSNASIKPGST